VLRFLLFILPLLHITQIQTDTERGRVRVRGRDSKREDRNSEKILKIRHNLRIE